LAAEAASADFGRARVRVTLLTSAGRASHQPRRTLGRSVVKKNFMLFSGKNIIVTGATGDLGTAITQRLIPQGVNVLAVASNEAGLARLITEVSGPGARDRPVGSPPARRRTWPAWLRSCCPTTPAMPQKRPTLSMAASQPPSREPRKHGTDCLNEASADHPAIRPAIRPPEPVGPA